MDQKQYDETLSRAVEDIAIIATRYGINSRNLAIGLDIGREPARYNEHTVTIAIRNTDLSVTAEGIPHHWLGVATGFVDTRLSRRIGPLLLQLENQAEAAGYRLEG